MKTAVLRLYRGDDAATPAEDESFGPNDSGAATADPAAPRVLPFPRFSPEARPVGHRRGAEETARRSEERGDSGAATLRFHAAHTPAADAGDRVSNRAADEAPDVLPLSAILSPPQFRSGSRSADLPDGAVAGRIGGWVSTPRGVTLDGPLSRAKALHDNRTCKCCGAGGVEPVLLSDGVTDAAGEQVPGSGTLVGFHCGRCQKEWPVA